LTANFAFTAGIASCAVSVNYGSYRMDIDALVQHLFLLGLICAALCIAYNVGHNHPEK